MTAKASKSSAGEDKPPAASPGAITFEDSALVVRCRKGDMRAFGALVAKYQDRICNMMFRMCSRDAEAEELAQEAFVRALQKISQFRGQSSFYTWLFRIAANLAISHGRRGGKIKFHSLTGQDDLRDSQAGALTSALAERRNPSPPAEAMTAETRQRVRDALEEMDDEYRLVVVLRDIEDMDYSQISDVLDVPVGTVKSRLHRARCDLKEKLANLVR